jgi:hypothetical protein
MPKKPLIIANSKEQFNANKSNPNLKSIQLILSSDAEQAARELYFKLRECDQLDVDLIWIKKDKNHHGGYWEAIWDRLSKAATFDYSARDV